jgi:hypothetical protein
MGQSRTLDNLETLDTSGTQDTEIRQTKHNRQSRDSGCQSLKDDRRRTPSDDMNSRCLWQCELNI